MSKNAKRTLVVLIVGAVVGVIFSGAFASFVQYSNTLDFCTSCHEMRDTVYKEYKETPHYSNRTGVRAVCADCHVPHKNWIATLVKKTFATKELIYHITGIVDSPEELDAKRLELAQAVWARMEGNDSRFCRNCHETEAMVLSSQKKRAQVKHKEAQDEGKTCIDCHKGIAHKPVHEELEKEESGSEDFKL